MRKFMKDKKIGKKLQLSFGTVIVMFLITIVIALTCIMMINNKMKDFYERPHANSVTQMEIRKDMQYVAKQLLWAMTTDDVEGTKEHISEVGTYGSKVMDNIAKLSANSDNKELIQKLEEHVAELAKQRVLVSDLALVNRNDEALVIFNGAYNDAIIKVQNTLIEIGEYQDKVAEDAFNTMTTLGAVSTVLMCVIGVICVLFCIYLASLITKSIQTPVLELEEAAQMLSAGQMHVDISYESKDELGILADNFRTAFAFLRAVIEDTGYVLGQISKGNFNVEFQNTQQYVGEFNGILVAMQSTVGNLDEAMKQINEGSEQVALGAGQMAESAQSLAEGATEQAGAIEELTATVETVNTMAKDSASSAKEAVQQSVEATEKAQVGQESMQKLVEAMENISGVSKEIENIIVAIEDIASQTNLLSLNASIEAARAGEAGKGFAVVADQIGKLASDSARSAVETKELIRKALDEIQNGNDMTQKTVGVLQEIVDSMNSFVDLAKGSSEISDTQAEMLNQIRGGIEQIANVVQNNSAAAEETSATSEELSAQSENLKALVDQFELKK